MIHLLGIRHHGPGSARQVVKRLRVLQPDLILVEGPPELDPILQWVGHAEMKPPVAALCYDEDDPARAVFYPFAEFSPEWQAIVYANNQGIPVRCVDLSLSLAWHLENSKTEEAEDDAAEPLQTPLAYMAQAAGYEDSDAWWEHVFEHQAGDQDAAAHFEAVLLTMKTLREAELPSHLDAENVFREAWMGQLLREAQLKMYDNIVVVCGAWHAPALLDLEKTEKSHAKTIKSIPKSKIKAKATWIPWTNDRLAFESGYGAGIHSPGWYRHLWKYPADTKGERWLVRVAQIFREKKMDTSTAHVIEAVRLAGALAALRALPKPGLDELNEAVRTVMCQGDDTLLGYVRKDLIVGHVLGKVPKSLPMLPLQADFEVQAKKLRLKQSAEKTDLDLDLRTELHLARSIFLHRLGLLGIRWGKLGGSTGYGTFRERWVLRWKPEMLVSLIEMGIWGNKIAEAAAAYLTHKAQHSQAVGEIATWIDEAIPAELFDLIEVLLRRVHELSAQSTDIMDLMAAIRPLAGISRYGNVRKSDMQRIAQLVEGLTLRCCIGLPTACYGLDQAASAKMFDLIRAVNESVQLLDNPALSQQWHEALRVIAEKEDGIPPVLNGCTNRLLFDASLLPYETVEARFSRALSAGNDAALAAAWLEGFLKGSAALLLYDQKLWVLLYDWVAQLPPDTFTLLMPILRRTFSKYEPAERRKIGEKAKYGIEDQPSASVLAAEGQLDTTLAELPLGLVLKMLGGV
jgi:hypothetical protein